MGTFDDKRLARPAVTKIRELAKGEFLDGAVNVLAFGLPGTGKTHACCALGHVLVEAGLSVFFTPAYMLVQDLLAAKREFELPRALRKLDNFDVVIIDDIGYVQQDREEMEVLFTFLAERYERKSVMTTSNHGRENEGQSGAQSADGRKVATESFPRCWRRKAVRLAACPRDAT